MKLSHIFGIPILLSKVKPFLREFGWKNVGNDWLIEIWFMRALPNKQPCVKLGGCHDRFLSILSSFKVSYTVPSELVAFWTIQSPDQTIPNKRESSVVVVSLINKKCYMIKQLVLKQYDEKDLITLTRYCV